MSTVQLRHGDMFDGPSDLIVLPCSTAGTVTTLVSEKLARFRIPTPGKRLSLGGVELMPFEGGESIAQYVAFAASVHGARSSINAIRDIGKELAAYTRKMKSIRRIAAPLLGAGAGGLEPADAVSALSEPFHEHAASDAMLTINVLDERVFRALTRKPKRAESSRKQSRPTDEAPLRVFISYTHGAQNENKWVRDFATFLRSNGIDARLDEWHLRPGMDLPQFMANELSQAHRVIVISDERYAEKADGRVGGVGWETMLIQGDLYRLSSDSRKYLAIVRSKRIESGIPIYLKTKFVIHWPDSAANDTNRTKILRELYDRVAIPPIGPRPVFVD